jgi:hypothetical protein
MALPQLPSMMRGMTLPRNFRTASAGPSQFCAGCVGQCLKQIAFRADDADLAVCDLARWAMHQIDRFREDFGT